MLNQLTEVIRKNLPLEVGENLQKVLAEGDAAKAEVLRLKELLKEANDANADFKVKLAAVKNLESREEAVTKKEKELAISHWEIKIKEAELKGLEKAFNMNHETVLAVFANNRFKYFESGQVPIVTPSAGYTQQHSFSKHIDLQG